MWFSPSGVCVPTEIAFIPEGLPGPAEQTLLFSCKKKEQGAPWIKASPLLSHNTAWRAVLQAFPFQTLGNEENVSLSSSELRERSPRHQREKSSQRTVPKSLELGLSFSYKETSYSEL